MLTRRRFMQYGAVAAVVSPKVRLTAFAEATAVKQADAAYAPDQRAGKPRASEFVFARLRYESGDWDYNPKVAANVLDSIVQYTSIAVYKEEVVISPGSTELLSFPFVFMTGHKLVRFTNAERDNLRQFAEAGG